MKRRLMDCMVCGGVLAAMVAAGAAFAQEAQQSKSGPVPGPGVVMAPLIGSKANVVIAGVPAYIWRHGCGPTAVGMVAGYWDGKGFDDLIPGSAATQSAAVTQAIASGGSSGSPWPGGSEQHYEDYARPQDNTPTMLQDDVLQAGRTPHPDNCIADFMRTSRSTANNYYGWSWSSDVIPAFTGYVFLRSPYYVPTAHQYRFGTTLTYAVVQQEIDAGRPMVFLVDSDGDGGTDHFIPIIGYNEGPPQKYIYYSTWDFAPHEAEFRAMTTSPPPNNYQWGVWGGWSFGLQNTFVFLSEPEGGTFLEGASLNWTVLVEGALGTPTYQWYKDSQPIPDRTDSTFAIDSLTEEDSGWYECWVTDGIGTVMKTEPVYLKVNKINAIPAAGSTGLVIATLIAMGCGILGVRRSGQRKRKLTFDS